jgi:hypothetical protein
MPRSRNRQLTNLNDPPKQLRRGFGGMGIAGICCKIKDLI